METEICCYKLLLTSFLQCVQMIENTYNMNSKERRALFFPLSLYLLDNVHWSNLKFESGKAQCALCQIKLVRLYKSIVWLIWNNRFFKILCYLKINAWIANSFFKFGCPSGSVTCEYHQTRCYRLQFSNSGVIIKKEYTWKFSNYSFLRI